MKTPEDILKEMNWTYDSDPGRFDLFTNLIKPAMESYAEQLKILHKPTVSNNEVAVCLNRCDHNYNHINKDGSTQELYCCIKQTDC